MSIKINGTDVPVGVLLLLAGVISSLSFPGVNTLVLGFLAGWLTLHNRKQKEVLRYDNRDD